MTEQQVENIIEGILFASGEPVEVAKLAQTLEMPKQEVRAVADHLMRKYQDREGGLCILKLEDSYQMCTNTAYGNYISLALQKKKKPVLSPAALEVLSIVAYKQPVTKAYVEQVRGVESSNVVNNLVNNWLNLGRIQNVLQVLVIKVGHPNTLDLASLNCVFHRTPNRQVFLVVIIAGYWAHVWHSHLIPWSWGVDQQQINIISSQRC